MTRQEVVDVLNGRRNGEFIVRHCWGEHVGLYKTVEKVVDDFVKWHQGEKEMKFELEFFEKDASSFRIIDNTLAGFEFYEDYFFTRCGEDEDVKK